MEEIKLSKKDIVIIKKKWISKKTNLRVEISHNPSHYSSADINAIKKYNDFSISEAYYLLKSNNIYIELIFGSLFLIIGVSLIIYEKYNENYANTIVFFGVLLFSAFGILIVLIPLTKKRTGLILDRMNSLVSYPDGWWFKPIVTHFKDISVYLSNQGKSLALKAMRSNFFKGYYVLSSFDWLSYWSFMVWYMDKNRPLPPGSAFDAYRQQDFERRKAEGFPPPLYYSCGILTPEATPEQQAEREQFWKDREYFAPQIKRPENSEIFHTRTHTHWVKTSFTDKNDLPVIDTWYEFTAEDGNIVYMLTDDQGKGYSPPKEQNYTAVRLTITERWW